MAENEITSLDILKENGFDKVLKQVSLDDTKLLSDELAEKALIKVIGKEKAKPSIFEITIGELAILKKYEITLDFLKELKLAPKSSNYLKVICGYGKSREKINVVANEYELNALKMLLLTGSNCKVIVSK